MRKLLMLRHGATEANERRVFTGSTDLPLSEGGVQALMACKESYPPATRFFTSGMRRTIQTLQILYGDVAHTDIANLAEYRFGDFEGRGHDDLFANETIYRQWLDRSNTEFACPGGETRSAFDRRVEKGWQELLAHDWTGLAVLVAHGGVIGCLMRLIVDGSGEYYQPPGNGNGYLITLTDTGAVASFEAFPS